jgi:hypothetical protein
MVHPHPGATSTNSSYLLSSFNRLQAQSHQNPTPPRTKDLCTSLDPPSSHYSTNPSIVYYNELHLALRISYSMHQALQFLITQIQLLALSQLAQYLCTIQLLLTLPNLLLILYKIGLNMGKPMGRHPIPIT